MTKQNWLLLLLALLLGALYIVYFTDWFRTEKLIIMHQSLNQSFLRRPGAPPPAPVIFGLRGPYHLKEIKVVNLATWKTNANTLPLWHLISDSNSVSVKDIPYGHYIQGMKPSVAGSRPQPLESNVIYRIFITTTKLKGEHDFMVGARITDTNSAAGSSR